MFHNHEKVKLFTIEWNDRAHGMFGVQTINVKNKTGLPWFLCSETLIREHRIRFVRESKQWLETLSEGYNVLENYILAENVAHIRWIKSLGFSLTEYHEKYGLAQKPFWKFRKVLLHGLI
jgi:hypothetical protein